ncbi:unnamed protein product [Vitrella brassicaformis CCMP3155]|uniref:TLDc domain-containing protein n=1 Tax=Vitrella brassicaformis (strain CCMP3155) TaxID=1169540 RepID=A0A0G4H474_VITBC|nr:unnamed protein product [Vitrella brassicaformis CCMP3155]|eukprot:CEM38371.1 unnamed protein product [Vitrella brassicaformis CCMP3155]
MMPMANQRAARECPPAPPPSRDRKRGSTADDEGTASIFRAIRMQGWSGLPMPRELHVGVYAFIHPVWCLKPPLSSLSSAIVLRHHTELVIDSSNPRQRIFWSSMTVRTAYDLGQQMVNLKCLIHRFPCTPENHVAPRWCLGIVIGLLEGHAAGRRSVREKEGLGTAMMEGSLQSLTFEAVPTIPPIVGVQGIRHLNNTIALPLPTTPSQSITLPALTNVKGVSGGHAVIDGRGWSMPTLQRVSARVPSSTVADMRPFIATSKSLVELEVDEMASSELAELIGSIPMGQRGRPGPLANLRRIGYIKLYEIESINIEDGLRQLQRCLVDRGCSKSLDFLELKVDCRDCHSLLLSEYPTLMALASFIDKTCSASGKVLCEARLSAEEAQHIPLTHLLAHTQFGKLPSSGPQLLGALLKLYNVQMAPQPTHPDCPSIDSFIGTAPAQYHYVWTVTPDQLLDRSWHAIDDSTVNKLVIGRGRRTSIEVRLADGWVPPVDAAPPEPPQIQAFKADGLLGVSTLTVKTYIGLGAVKALLNKGLHLEKMQLFHMTATDVIRVLEGMGTRQMPKNLRIEGLRHTHDESRIHHISRMTTTANFQKVKALIVGGEVAMWVAAALRQHMPSLESFIMCGREAEVRSVLVDGAHDSYMGTRRSDTGIRAGFNTLTLGFVSEDQRFFVKAEDERKGITLGDHKERLPQIRTLIIHLDVPPANVVDPGTFILSSIWSLLEIDSITALTVVPPQATHLDAFSEAVRRRFGPGQVPGIIGHGDSRIVLTADAIQTMRKAVFAHSSAADTLRALQQAEVPDQRRQTRMTSQRISSMLHHYLPSLDANIAAEALASDFVGRMRAAPPMSVIDPPYTRAMDPPYARGRLRRLVIVAMQRYGLGMEPMMRLQGSSPCIPSPSVIASASQLMAILRMTGKHITGIELLYKATEHGHQYTDMLNRVGDGSCLLFLVRTNGDTYGCFIDDSLRPPEYSFSTYSVDALIFSTSGVAPPTLQSPPASHRLHVAQAGNEHRHGSPKFAIGRPVAPGVDVRLWLWADGPGLAAGGCPVRVVLGSLTDPILFRADEIEVMRLVGQCRRGAERMD